MDAADELQVREQGTDILPAGKLAAQQQDAAQPVVIGEVAGDGLAHGLEIVFAQRLVGGFQHQDAGIGIQLDVDARALGLADP